MAFLRSVTRYNSIVSRNIPATACTVAYPFSSTSTTLASSDFNRTSSRSELLSLNQRYYVDIRRELNTNRSAPASSIELNNGQKNVRSSQMSTIAAAPTSKIRPVAATAASNDQSSSPPQRDPLDTSFNDPIAAFKSKTTWELIRAYIVYIMCSSEYLVENNMKVKKIKSVLKCLYAIA